MPYHHWRVKKHRLAENFSSFVSLQVNSSQVIDAGEFDAGMLQESFCHSWWVCIMKMHPTATKIGNYATIKIWSFQIGNLRGYLLAMGDIPGFHWFLCNANSMFNLVTLVSYHSFINCKIINHYFCLLENVPTTNLFLEVTYEIICCSMNQLVGEIF